MVLCIVSSSFGATIFNDTLLYLHPTKMSISCVIYNYKRGPRKRTDLVYNSKLR